MGTILTILHSLVALLFPVPLSPRGFLSAHKYAVSPTANSLASLTTTSSPLKNKQTKPHTPTKTLKDRNTKHVYSKQASIASSASHGSTLLRGAVHHCPGVTCVLGSEMMLLPTWLSFWFSPMSWLLSWVSWSPPLPNFSLSFVLTFSVSTLVSWF